MNNKKITISLLFFYLLLTISIIFLVVNIILILEKVNPNKTNLNNSEKNLKSYHKEYKFISPLLDCADQIISYNESKELDIKITKVIERNIHNSKIESASVYFRDLNNGPWINYNPEEKFSPASLMKVPLLIAYLKKAESNKSFLEEKINSENAKSYLDPNIDPRLTIEQNTDYSVLELLEMMIIHSDNAAAQVLLNNLSYYEIDYVYYDLGLNPNEWQEDNFLTVRDYSSFFRILYNASYLNREMSEFALSILAKSEYDAGIKSGIKDKNIIVSHKFGERGIGNSKQLHDCGIIYNYDKPYLLCIMTRGDDFLKIREAIKEISQVFYQELELK
ncbi:serine hydrolase [Patescibacteria group bacterium]|nr:serine hydrolase [Patescibacteria group bacterium]